MQIHSNNRWILLSGTLMAMVAVMLGAFAAHSLKTSLDSYRLSVFETGARYQMYHALALILSGLMAGFNSLDQKWFRYAGCAFLLGILLFSGSLYCLALSGIKWFGAITPIGGVAFIIGWLLLLVGIVKSPLAD